MYPGKMPQKKRTSAVASVLAGLIFAFVLGPMVITGCSLGVLLYALAHETEYQERFVQKQIVDSLKDIMYGLIYPAVLGTGFVLFVSHVVKAPLSSWLDDSTRYPAIAAGLFYILSFTALSGGGEGKTRLSYQWLPFIVDWIEVALMFSCFYFLGLIDEHAKVQLVAAYVCLMADVILIQPVWRLVAGAEVWTAIKRRVIVTFLLGAAMLTVHYPKLHPWMDLIAAFVVLIFVASYIYEDVKEQKRRWPRLEPL